MRGIYRWEGIQNVSAITFIYSGQPTPSSGRKVVIGKGTSIKDIRLQYVLTSIVRVHVAYFKAQGWATVGELEREPHWRELDSERFDWSGNRFGWLAQP